MDGCRDLPARPHPVNETLKWLSPLPILIQIHSGGDYSVTYSVPRLYPWDFSPR